MIKIIVSLSPSLIFLLCLQLLDSYKLVKLRTVLLLIVSGAVTALAAYFINVNFIELFELETRFFSKFIAPVIEELLKASVIIFFMYRNRIGFIVDAAIFGFAVGAGFATLENIYYLGNLGEANITIWIIRGLGTAIMHACTTAIFSMISKYYIDKKSHKSLLTVFPLIIVPVLIHMLFNNFVLPPVAFTALQLTITPVLFYLIFLQSEMQLKEWMELSLESNQELLASINEGVLLESKAGRYLNTLKNKFSPLVLADLICYVRLYIELSMLSKGLLIMKEAGFVPPISNDLKSKLEEIKFLERNIGYTGKLAIQPIVYNEKGIGWIKDLLLDQRVK